MPSADPELRRRPPVQEKNKCLDYVIRQCDTRAAERGAACDSPQHNVLLMTSFWHEDN